MFETTNQPLNNHTAYIQIGSTDAWSLSAEMPGLSCIRSSSGDFEQKSQEKTIIIHDLPLINHY
jgi:hypothetical protein